ncbi:response regulator (plasmid) [Paraburkholderia sp. DD10]|uniref:response regulator n=1 Tax=Paraburkholderia sp. DD10 TaxID=3409691 RepID=UPI003BA28BC3
MKTMLTHGPPCCGWNGWEVIRAPSGDAALAGLARPDLLITDWNMSGMEGPALCRAFRDDATLASLPIPLVSSLELPPGATVLHDHFQQKPSGTVTLLAAITVFLASPSTTESAPVKVWISIVLSETVFW